ncbi:glycoside hydrolase family 43 protein [Atractiella rhizophila]|nr:glycoside hydrolase family 43 protein [Atractiella rhizophila]
MRGLLFLTYLLPALALPDSSRDTTLFPRAKYSAGWRTDATYINDNSSIGADPYVRWDDGTQQYWAYSTEGADAGWFFGIYTSPDLTTWTRHPGGAIKNATESKLKADDWYWAPECYYNPKTKWYFLFHAGRMTNPKNAAQHFKYPDFEEASKVFVAVSRNPGGPFISIKAEPIDYYPFDPDYHDVNLIMSPPYLVPPSNPEEGATAPKGTYIPFIDPNVYFDDKSGAIYLFYSRNCYRNWVWDPKYNKYVEESNILVVQLERDWWDDPSAKTLPRVHSKYRDANKGKTANWTTSVNASFEGPTRMDGWVSVISRTLQPQIWEDAHVYDYSSSNGTKKDRRWSEGSSTFKRYDEDGNAIYYLIYSSNNFESVDYGVGYAYSSSITGPFTKSTTNPILSQDASRKIYSTGHGSVVAALGKDSTSELYYVHHARPDPSSTRYLYTSRFHLDVSSLSIAISSPAGDLRIPSGVAPFSISVDRNPGKGEYKVAVKDAQGVEFDLRNPSNRVAVIDIEGNEVGTVNGSSVSLNEGVKGEVSFRYQRARWNVSEPWSNVKQGQGLEGWKFVEANITVS